MEALFDGRVIPWERRNVMSAERKELEKKSRAKNGTSLKKCRWTIASGFKRWKICSARRDLTRKWIFIPTVSRWGRF